MGLFFSASTKGFYDNKINKTMPPDVVPVEYSVRDDLLSKVGGEFTLESDADGKPIAVPVPVDIDSLKEKAADAVKQAFSRRIKEVASPEVEFYRRGLQAILDGGNPSDFNRVLKGRDITEIQAIVDAAESDIADEIIGKSTAIDAVMKANTPKAIKAVVSGYLAVL